MKNVTFLKKTLIPVKTYNFFLRVTLGSRESTTIAKITITRSNEPDTRIIIDPILSSTKLNPLATLVL